MTTASLPDNLTAEEYDAMRPYRDDEINAAMHRIAASPHFGLLSSYVFPDNDPAEVAELLKSLHTIDHFQKRIMSAVNEQIIKRSITRFTYSGLDTLDPDQRYLFVSNHRDIMLDSSLLQYALWLSGHETSEITFGANLMTDPTVVDIGKANKMFRVERGGSLRDFYRSSLKLSSYLRHTLTQRRQSIWIAQRNGRTKDGLDLTEPGLISMFACSRPDAERVSALAELNIVPVAISYEWETCDRLKARELALRADGTPYVKTPDEDLNSILQGIVEPKGRVHIAVGTPLTASELSSITANSRQDFARAVASLIDTQIYALYHLWPTNYAAVDLKENTDRRLRQGLYT
ncbi:MAG: 1-acyl-sn-glycerol-3-phosphate acyltransferase, partial [Muribaculaceae bacterium]|nr:1-acyl-sn-glycerol-3-phosphate acyltransferase [Muribaculaceae bacterium]